MSSKAKKVENFLRYIEKYNGGKFLSRKIRNKLKNIITDLGDNFLDAIDFFYRGEEQIIQDTDKAAQNCKSLANSEEDYCTYLLGIWYTQYKDSIPTTGYEGLLAYFSDEETCA